MRHLFLALLFLMVSCENHAEQSQEEKKIEKREAAEKKALIDELEAKKKELHEARQETKLAQEKLILREKQEKEAFLKAEEKKAKEQAQNNENEKLSKLGISVKDSSITIDTNTTKSFFQKIGKRVTDRLEKITKEIKEDLSDTKRSGIDINPSHINIDLNKTNNLVERLGNKVQGVIKEFDNIAKEFDINLSK